MDSSSYCTVYCCLMVIIGTTSGMIRHHGDGSMSSNSGHMHPLQRLGRFKKASFYINSEPRLSSSGAAMANDMATVLVDEHNKFRRVVSSTNMQIMTWDSTLAASAQAHADQCIFQHTAPSYRNFGENIWASPNSNVGSAVSWWFSEAYDGYCGCSNGYKDCCGHYTQVVWAETNKVGCGLANCGNVFYAPGQRYLLVCHYSPGGNVLQMNDDGSVGSYPAFNYRQNSQLACSECPSGSFCNNGLCEVK